MPANLRAAKDPAAAAAALGKAAAAHKADGYNWSLLAYAQPEMPADASPTEQYVLATSLIGYEAAWASPLYNVVTNLCSKEGVADAGVRQNCEALADLLISHGTTLIDLSIGASIGSNLGWPSERLKHLSQERNALMQVLMEPMASDGSDQWDCNHVRSGNELLRQITRIGELGAAREALEGSGETVEELAQQRRAQHEEASSAAP